MRSVLITGGTGFIGSHLVDTLEDKFDTICVLTRQKIKSHRSKVVYIEEKDLDSTFSFYKFHAVVHLATFYGRGEENLENSIKVNIQLPVKLALLAIKFDCKVFLNTDTFYNKGKNQSSQLKIYSSTKRAAWDTIVDITKLYDSNVVFLNLYLFHVYGPKDRQDKFIPWLVRSMKEDQKDIDLTDGHQKRDFIHVFDVVEAYSLVLEKFTMFDNYSSIDIGSGQTVELRTFINKLSEHISKISNKTPRLNFGKIDNRENINSLVQADIDLLSKINWKPNVDLDEGIQTIIQ